MGYWEVTEGTNLWPQVGTSFGRPLMTRARIQKEVDPQDRHLGLG